MRDVATRDTSGSLRVILRAKLVQGTFHFSRLEFSMRQDDSEWKILDQNSVSVGWISH